MAERHLALVERSIEGPAERARRLYSEAQAAASEHLALLNATLREVSQMAADVAQGGEAYPAGARDLCRRLADELGRTSQTLEATSRRQTADSGR